MSQFGSNDSAFYSGATRYGGSANARRREAARKAFFTIREASSSSRSNVVNGPSLVTQYTINSTDIVRKEPMAPQLTAQAKKIYSWIQDNSYAQQETFQLSKRTNLKKHRFNPMAYRAPIVKPISTKIPIPQIPVLAADKVKAISPPPPPPPQQEIEPTPQPIKISAPNFCDLPKVVPKLCIESKIEPIPRIPVPVAFKTFHEERNVSLPVPEITPKTKSISPPPPEIRPPPSIRFSAPKHLGPVKAISDIPVVRKTFAPAIDRAFKPKVSVDVIKQIQVEEKTPVTATVTPERTPISLFPPIPTISPIRPATSFNGAFKSFLEERNVSLPVPEITSITKPVSPPPPEVKPPPSTRFSAPKHLGPVKAISDIPVVRKTFAPAIDRAFKPKVNLDVFKPKQSEEKAPEPSPITSESKPVSLFPSLAPVTPVKQTPVSAPITPTNAPIVQNTLSTLTSKTSPIHDVEMDIDADPPTSTPIASPPPPTPTPTPAALGTATTPSTNGPPKITFSGSSLSNIPTPATIAPPIPPMSSQPIFMPPPSFSIPTFTSPVPQVTTISMPNGSNPFQPPSSSTRGRKILRPARRLHR